MWEHYFSFLASDYDEIFYYDKIEISINIITIILQKNIKLQIYNNVLKIIELIQIVLSIIVS